MRVLVSEMTFYDPESDRHYSGQEIFEAVLEEQTKPKARFNWLKMFAELIDDWILILGTPAAKVLGWTIKKLNKSTNEFNGTYSEISEELGVGRATVSRTMDASQKVDYIRPVSAGVWMVNPTRVFAGDEDKDTYLRRKYFELRPPSLPKTKTEEALDMMPADEPESLRDRLRRLEEEGG